MEAAVEQMVYPTYERYKDSGVEWLGEIPEHWETNRIKYLFNEINERSESGDEELLSVSQYTGVTKKSDKIEEGELLTNASTLEGYKKVSAGDLVSNIMLAWNGSLGFSPVDGITSPAYSIYRLLGKNSKKYFHYLLRSDLYKSEFKRKSSGVIESRLRLYTDDFFRIPAILPPSEEQSAIATFLDKKTAQIDQAIARKERQIELLKEHRQILIHHAVTRGLDPNLPMKDSGVEWIGEIPEHWEVKKVKHVTTKIGSGVTPSGGGSTYLDEGIPLLRSQNILFGKIDLNGVARISLATHDSMKNTKVEAGDVLLNITGGSIGRCHHVDFQMEMNVNQHVCIIRPSGSITSIFLNSLLSSEVGQGQIWYFQQGGGREGLNFQAIKNFVVTLPPIDEQKRISDWIADIGLKFEASNNSKEREIEKLKELKASLINAAVTGKIKVCNLSGMIPYSITKS
jgi:type I restriction enzyme S subunit